MQRQLSIFDTLQPLDTAESKVKAGDYVKLRRKSPSAAYWKKGEIVQIEAVHPTNGSVKFWDERAQTWGYLHPDDFAKTLPPIESVPPRAIALVAESEPIPDVAESPAPPDVAESKPAVGEIDSATKSVSTYRPKGSARGGEYFRFVYRAGTKTKSVHIPGGNTGSILAQSRAAEVMELSAAGVPLLEIVEHIKRWSTRRHLET